MPSLLSSLPPSLSLPLPPSLPPFLLPSLPPSLPPSLAPSLPPSLSLSLSLSLTLSLSLSVVYACHEVSVIARSYWQYYTNTSSLKLIYPYRCSFDLSKPPTINEELESPMQVSVTTCAPLPVPLYHAQGVLLKGQVYIGGYQQAGESFPNEIYRYNPVTDKWDLFTCAPTSCFALTVFKNLLTVVSGVVPETSLYSYVVHMLEKIDATEKTWKALAESMCYGRKGCVATSFATYLIVAGGLDVSGKVVDTVEIYNDDTSQWHSVLPPSPWRGRAHISTTFAQASWYLLGGTGEGESTSELFHRFPLTLLLESLSSSQIRFSPWKKLPSAINTHSALGLLNGSLITVGGRSTLHQVPTSLMHCLSTDEHYWERVGWLPKAVEKAATISISKNCVLVVGGLTGAHSDMAIPTASVYKLLAI